MSIVVEITIPAEEFALSETLSTAEDEAFRAARLVAHESGRVMPFLWIDCEEVAHLCKSMDDDPSVSGFTVLAAFDGQCLLRVEWEPRVRVFLSVLRAEGGFVLEASGYDEVWQFRTYFSDYDSVSAVRECCADRGMDVSVEAEAHLSSDSDSGYFGLTERQYETVVSAYELGYYDVPRAITQAELADRFSVSHQALSERLRRAHETLVENGLPRVAHRRDHSVSPRAFERADI